jgi:hypothetical protein
VARIRIALAGKQERTPEMSSITSDIFCFVLGLAEAFMVWVLWNFYKAGHRR